MAAENCFSVFLFFRHKAVEIARMRDKVPIGGLLKQAAMAPPARDFIGALRAKAAASGRPGLIAEVKKASPSRGVIQPDFDPVRVRTYTLNPRKSQTPLLQSHPV